MYTDIHMCPDTQKHRHTSLIPSICQFNKLRDDSRNFLPAPSSLFSSSFFTFPLFPLFSLWNMANSPWLTQGSHTGLPWNSLTCQAVC